MKKRIATALLCAIAAASALAQSDLRFLAVGIVPVAPNVDLFGKAKANSTATGADISRLSLGGVLNF